MENNNLSAANERKSPLTVKNVLRVISLLCIAFAFCPSFLVSCSGKDVDVNVMTAVKGVTVYGEKVVASHPVMLICFLLPAAMLVLLFVNKLTDRKTAGIISLCAACDFVIWLIFRYSVKKIADENYCTFETKAGFVLNITALILIILLTAIVVLGKLQMDSDFVRMVTGTRPAQTVNRTPGAGGKIFCGYCGAENTTDAKFCKECGQPLDNDVKPEAVSPQNVPNADAVQTPQAAPSMPKIDTSQIIDKIKTLPKAVYAGAAAAVVLLVIICAAATSGPTINLDKYVVMEANGYDGYGTASAVIQWDAIKKDYGEKLAYTKKAKKIGKAIEYIPPIETLKGSVSITLQNAYGLSNGDEIAYTWKVEEDLSDYLKCKVKYHNGTYKISDLSEVGTFDAFNGLKVSFSGMAPNGTVEWSYTGSKLKRYDFSCDRSSGLQNGDIVTFMINEREPSYYAQQYGAVPESFEKVYKVTGLDEYVTSYSDLTADFIATLKSEAEDTISAYAASSYNSGSSLTNLEYSGYIMDNIKYGVWYANSYNDVYLIYTGTVSNPEGYFDTEKVYFPVKFRNILKSGTSLTYERNEGVLGYSSLGGSFSTKGYVNPLICYMDLVEANRENYTAECGDGFEVYAKYDLIDSLDDISDTYKDTLYADAKDKIESYIADSYNIDMRVTELSLVGEYLLLAKNQGTDFANNNKYYVVYTADVSHAKGSIATTTVYFPVEYNGIVKLPGEEYMTTSGGEIRGDSKFDVIWDRTKGYMDGTQMYADLVTSKRENYTYEMSEGLKQFGE